MEKKETYFVDIDGTILKYVPFSELSYDKTELLPGVEDWFDNKRSEGHMIILVTARPNEKRVFTEKQLKMVGIKYDKLLMGMNRGIRYLINDIPTEYVSPKKAIAINVNRNEGFTKL